VAQKPEIKPTTRQKIEEMNDLRNNGGFTPSPPRIQQSDDVGPFMKDILERSNVNNPPSPKK
jgi:hypothetical protein